MPEPWRVLSSEPLLSNRWFSVQRQTISLPGGDLIDDYHVIDEPDFVKVCAVTAAGEVVFVRDYKHGAARVLLELPGGLVETGESPAIAAARELREETGFAGELRQVLTLHFNPTREQTREHIFFGRVRAEGAPRLEPTEQAEVELIPAEHVRGLIAAGEILPMSTVAAALFCLPLLAET